MERFIQKDYEYEKVIDNLIKTNLEGTNTLLVMTYSMIFLKTYLPKLLDGLILKTLNYSTNKKTTTSF